MHAPQHVAQHILRALRRIGFDIDPAFRRIAGGAQVDDEPVAKGHTIAIGVVDMRCGAERFEKRRLDRRA